MTQRLRRRLTSTVAGVVCLLVLPVCSHAAAPARTVPPAAVTGTITAINGKIRLPGVVISLSTGAGAPLGEAVTDEQGRYRIETTATGSCRLRAAIEGFHPADGTVELSQGATRTLDFDLKLIEIEQTVNVTPTADVPLNLAKPLTQAQSIDGRALAASAMSSGSVAAEMRWLPGVSPYGREWAIKGGRPNEISMQIEGAQVVDPASGTSPLELPGDAVDTIQVLANPYAVEFGRFSSGVIVVSTRSGANKWTGTVNNFLPGFIVKRGGNPFRLKGVESLDPRVALGGPLIKGRLFVAESAQFRYQSSEVASRPQDERAVSKSFSSFTRMDLVVNSHNTLTGTFTLAPGNSDSVNLSTFNPPESTADMTQRVHRMGVSDTAQLPHALVLESLVHFTRYRSAVDGHGDATDMILAPEGNSGIYYGHQNRRSTAWQVSETLSGFVSNLSGEHLIKGGVDLLRADYTGEHEQRPIDILREDGTRTSRLTETASHLDLAAADIAGFVQDRWHLTNRLLLELGLRVERDGVFDRVNFIPRLGAALALDDARNLTVRGGWGYFYERTPTLVGAFNQLADSCETFYGPDGVVPLAGQATCYGHRLGSDLETPRSRTWNIGYEHRISPWLSVRLNHLERDGRHELVVEATRTGGTGWLTLGSAGSSRYRDTEVGAHIKRGARLELDVSYTRSHSAGDLNDAYGYYLNPTANPIVRTNQFGPTDTDSPNRFVFRGRSRLQDTWVVEVGAEARTGYPYSAVDEQLEFVGARNSRRFPGVTTMDASIEKRFRFGRLQPWIGVVFINALNGFAPADVQRNLASPGFGNFYSSTIRQVRITVHFHS